MTSPQTIHLKLAFASCLTWLTPILLAVGHPAIHADDWPQWFGPQRDGVWRETNIIHSFDPQGPPVKWRSSIRPSYVGPAVADGRLYLLDRQVNPQTKRVPGERPSPLISGTERVLCLDSANGQLLWERSYDCPYAIAYPSGPRATPVVCDGRVYSLGAMGDLQASDASTGTRLWSRKLPAEFATEPPVWGYAAHPLLDGDRLIVPVGGTNSAIVAFHKDTGAVVWQALTVPEIGYAPPVIHEIDGKRQLIFWHPDAVNGLQPETGELLWSHPYPVDGRAQRPEVTIAMPRISGRQLFLTSFYQGALLLRLPEPGGEASVIWNRRSTRQSEVTQGLATVMSTPFIRNGRIYGICAFGELRCLALSNGEREWESREVFGDGGGFFATAFMIEQAGRTWIWTDQGELLLAGLKPDGIEVVSRAKVLEPIEHTRGRDVLWCHPAFAERSIFVHNGRELVCLDVAGRGAGVS